MSPADPRIIPVPLVRHAMNIVLATEILHSIFEDIDPESLGSQLMRHWLQVHVVGPRNVFVRSDDLANHACRLENHVLRLPRVEKLQLSRRRNRGRSLRGPRTVHSARLKRDCMVIAKSALHSIHSSNGGAWH